MRFEAGHHVRVEFTKWGGRPHYVFDGLFLGEDEYGEWLGHRAGTLLSRPGREFTAELDWVTLLPHRDAAHVVAFNPEPHPFEVYVDITTPPVWEDATVRIVDLDLDVIRTRDERGTFVEDQDEFEEHQLAFGYPAEIITLAEESAERVYGAVAGRQAPYDGSAERWLAALARR
jgi:hypothetical protein